MKHLEKMIELEGETNNAFIKDGCALKTKFISTSHVNDGEDVVGQV